MEEQIIEDDRDEITAEQIAIEEELNPEEDAYDEDEQDVDFGLGDLRNIQQK